MVMGSSRVDIGVLEEKDGWLLHPKFFPSKVGGKPAWLDLKDLPKPSVLTCKNCKDPLIFLCQVYAPYEESEDCFHRTIFVFLCRNGSCCRTNSTDNFLVLRCQLPRKNDYYSYEPYEEIEEDFKMDTWPKLCNLCGARGPSHCSKCKKIFYCSRSHQILDWQKSHKRNCTTQPQATDDMKPNNFIVTEAGKSILFKEWEIIVDEEDKEDSKNVNVNQEMEKLRQMIQEKKAGTLHNVSDGELEQYSRTTSQDKIFNKFSRRVARHPDQVLRYDRGGSPLWITSNFENSFDHIPNCQYCNGERQFEFQVMPQLLNFINVGVDFNSIDWGVLAIYTCKASCKLGSAYMEEIMIKQDLST